MMPWQREHPEQRIRELRAEAEYRWKALENIEAQIQKRWERMG